MDDARDKIKHMLKVFAAENDITFSDMAKMADMLPQTFSDQLRRGSLRVIRLHKIMDALGYDIVFKKRDNK
jgi:hypothetical protein